jgi:hypothetical protein
VLGAVFGQCTRWVVFSAFPLRPSGVGISGALGRFGAGIVLVLLALSVLGSPVKSRRWVWCFGARVSGLCAVLVWVWGLERYAGVVLDPVGRCGALGGGCIGAAW